MIRACSVVVISVAAFCCDPATCCAQITVVQAFSQGHVQAYSTLEKWSNFGLGERSADVTHYGSGAFAHAVAFATLNFSRNGYYMLGLAQTESREGGRGAYPDAIARHSSYIVFTTHRPYVVTLEGSASDYAHASLWWNDSDDGGFVLGLSGDSAMIPAGTYRFEGSASAASYWEYDPGWESYGAFLSFRTTAKPNLVSNGSFENGVTGFQSQYASAPEGNTTGGQFTVGTAPQEWNSQYAPTRDFTSGDGNMLIVNGAQHPESLDPPAATSRDYFWQQTVDVLPSTAYWASPLKLVQSS